MAQQDFKELAELLRKRLQIIADRELRERDPAGQLGRLQEISESISRKELELAERKALPPRLEHFLKNCSYQKALEWIEDQEKTI